MSRGWQTVGSHLEKNTKQIRLNRLHLSLTRKKNENKIETCRYSPIYVVRLHRFNISDCGYEVHVSLYYEFMPRTLR
jgi:hypothetical protein